MKLEREFDGFAETYQADLNQALAVSGETGDHFARERVKWLATQLSRLGEKALRVVDYGCGVGGTAPILEETLGAEFVLGLEVSPRSLEVARSRFSSSARQFLSFSEATPRGDIDVVYCNGVFHHIPLDERPAAVDYVYRLLRPGGIFALWENNPWNPGTRYVMSQCVFDRDAETLNVREGSRLVARQGFQILRRDFLFVFPAALRGLRFLEPAVCSIPLGAQYQVLCRKPR